MRTETTKTTIKKTLTEEEKTLLLERKLMEFSHKLSVPKTEHNDFGNYMYCTADAILNACKPLEREFNASVFTDATLMECVGKLILDTTATFMDLDTGAKTQTHSYTLYDLNKPKMSAEQVSGSCNTYGRKYALQNLLSIDDSEFDPDVADNTTATGYNGEVLPQQGSNLTNVTAVPFNV